METKHTDIYAQARTRTRTHTQTHTQQAPTENMPTHAHSRDKQLDSITEKGEAEKQEFISLLLLHAG